MTARASRRQVLALIALADAPMPVKVDFDGGGGDHLQLVFDRIEQAQQWGPVLGIPADDMRRAGTDIHQYVSSRGEHVAHYTVYVRPWRGWRVLSLLAIETQAPDASLDDATRGQLQAVADEPATGDGAPC